MKNLLAIAGALLIGIGVIALLCTPPPANSGTLDVPIVADVVAPAPPAPAATHTPAIQPASAGTVVPGGQLVALRRLAGTGGGCCPGGSCPLRAPSVSVSVAPATAPACCSPVAAVGDAAVTVDVQQRGRRSAVTGAVCGAGKVVRGILGHNRRAARRQARGG